MFAVSYLAVWSLRSGRSNWLLCFLLVCNEFVLSIIVIYFPLAIVGRCCSVTHFFFSFQQDEKLLIFLLYTPPHDSGGILWFHVGRPCVCPSVRISFPDDNLSKHQWIFTKLGKCIDIMEVWFGNANGQISSNFDGVICPRHVHIFVSEW